MSQEEINSYVSLKIMVMRDMKILDRRKKKKEKQLREILGRSTSEVQMDNKIRDVIVGRVSVDDFIRKNYAS